nr:acetate--CoA ligase family protein [Halomonas socia]
MTMTPAAQRLDWAASALDPAAVAIIGATDNPNSVGGRPIHYMQRFGFQGAIYPVNPRRSRVQGLTCYPSLADLPTTPDLAIIALSAARAEQAVRDCVDQGIQAIIIMSSGFRETGEAGRQAERRLVEITRAGGSRLIGPNSQGLANLRSGAIANFSTMFAEVPPQDGPIAIISQSGAASVMPYALLRENDLGARYVLATGNEADLTTADLLDGVLEDSEIRLVLLYMEGIQDADALARAAQRARRRGVAVVALKPGSSARGASAARSHTGALASEDAVVTAYLRRHGIWRVQDTAELARAAALYLGEAPTGKGCVLIMSHSGAVGVVCADAAERLGVTLPELSDVTARRLREIMPAFGAIQNPLDLTAGLLGDSALFEQALAAIADDPAIDIIHIGVPVAGQGYDLTAFASAARAVIREKGKPVVVSGPQRNVLQQFSAQGIPTFQSDTDALAAIRQVVAHRALMAEELPIETRHLAAALPADAGEVLDEVQSLELLEAIGIPVVVYRVCRSPDEAESALHALGTPCVVKACSAALPHKSEHGLVKLGVDSPKLARQMFDDCTNIMHRLGADGTVVVARQETGRRELVLGAKRDPVFGPVIMAGDGGKYVEALRDYELLAPPFTADEVLRALQRTRIWPVLQGARDEPPLDLPAFCDAAERLGSLMLSEERIESIDLNPVLVRSIGQGMVVLDALVVLTPGRPGNDAKPSAQPSSLIPASNSRSNIS